MDRFQFDKYLVRKKVLKLMGAAFHIYAGEQYLIMYAKLKAFALKEDIRLYTDEGMTEQLLTIRARNIIDLAATYDVYDAETGSKLGSLRRKGLKSMLKDEWLILDAYDKENGTIKEDSLGMALLRRFLINLIPQTYEAEINHIPVCVFKQNFNPFVTKVSVEFRREAEELLDKRMGIAAAVLLCAIEGKQK